MSKSLTGKAALVTGGSRNVGRETALALADRGADVIVTYRERAAEAANTVREVEARGGRASAHQADFSTSGEIQSLTPYLAKHLGPRGITVNAVAPGGLDDEFNAYLFDELMPGARDYIAGQTALGRVGLPADVAGVIAALAEPQWGFVSGQVVGIDGGYHL